MKTNLELWNTWLDFKQRDSSAPTAMATAQQTFACLSAQSVLRRPNLEPISVRPPVKPT